MNNLYQNSKDLLKGCNIVKTRDSVIAGNLMAQVSVPAEYDQEFSSTDEFRKAFEENEWEYFLTPDKLQQYTTDLKKANLNEDDLSLQKDEVDNLVPVKIDNGYVWLQKGRTKEGVYANTAENKKLGRVGQQYKRGEGKEESKSKKESGGDSGSFRTKMKGKEVSVKYKMEGDDVVIDSVIGKDGGKVEDMQEEDFDHLEGVAKKHFSGGDKKEGKSASKKKGNKKVEKALVDILGESSRRHADKLR